jgi:hypothetical protein
VVLQSTQWQAPFDTQTQKQPNAEGTMHRVLENVRCTHTADGGVILDILRGRMFSLNFVGSKILELMQRGCDEAHIVGTISKQFNVLPEIVRTDFQEFLAILKENKLLEVRNDIKAL